MKKVFVTSIIALLSLFMASTVIATKDMSNTMWSLRGDIGQNNIDNLKGHDIESAWGTFSANLNLRWNNHAQGELAIQGWTDSWEKFRFSLNWNSKGNNYDIHFIDDNEDRTIIDGHGRVIYNGHVEYWVPIVITYHKLIRTVDIAGPDFSFSNIPVIDLKNPEAPEVIHDVALIDFTNSIGGIRLEETDGTDILGNDLQCDTSYRIGIKIQNNGNFTEDVTYTGSINGIDFAHIPNTLAPGSSSTKTRTVTFPSSPGPYTIIVEAIIPIDDVPANNIAQRDVNIVCD